jgi:hypothetical protein
MEVEGEAFLREDLFLELTEMALMDELSMSIAK